MSLKLKMFLKPLFGYFLRIGLSDFFLIFKNIYIVHLKKKKKIEGSVSDSTLMDISLSTNHIFKYRDF